MISMIFFWSCTDNQKTTELNFTVRVAGKTSKKAFKATVHPLLVKRCSGCHGDSGTAIRHSVSDYEEAHDVVVDGGKVNFSTPKASRLVDKLINQNHNCWGGDCVASSNEMLAAIEQWIELRGVSDTGVGQNVTGNLKYGDAQIRVPETVNGTVVLQAEDGELLGRFKPKTSSTASSYSYIAGDLAPSHPIELTPRTGSLHSGYNAQDKCRPISSAEVADATNGRYRVSERRRHFNSQGYRYYNQRISFRIIRPDKRSDYLAKLEAGQTSLADLEGFFLTEDGPDNMGVYQGDIVEATRGDTLRVLPDFMNHSNYNSLVLGNNPSYKNFFAPRFGDGGIDYFLPSNDEIRKGLPDAVKTDIVYEVLKESFRRFYYNSNNSLVSIRNVPYFLSRGPVILNNTTTNANTLLNTYWDLAEANALSSSGYTDTTIDRIDTYVHYYVDPNDRNFEDFRWELDSGTQNFDINRGNETLDLSAFYVDADSVDTRTIMTENYGETLHNVLKANCAGCHGNGAGRPRFASNNGVEAFDAVIGYISFDNPASSRPATRMDEGHNCGSSCQAIKSDIVAAINQWQVSNTADIEAANSANAPKLTSVSLKERTPGRARYKFRVTQAGAYTFWAKIMTVNNQKESFMVRLLDEQGRPMDPCNASGSCPFDVAEYRGRSQAQLDGMHCENYNNLGTNDTWTWYTKSINNLENRRKWDLQKGVYTLEIIEDQIDTKIDMIAISKNPEFNPRENLIDEGLILSTTPRILKYDISAMIGAPGFFEIEIIEKNGGDSYVFRNPQFVGLKENIKVSNIKLLVNDTYEFSNSSFTKINDVVGPEQRILTSASLVALSISGTGSDTFKFAFDDIKKTSAPLTKPEDDVPVAVEGRVCLNLALFESTVMPILNRLRLVRKFDEDDSYQDYTSSINNFPGQNRNGGSAPTFYTCTTCHTEDHPYFKMTTFFDRSDVLCSQALSRVDFSNFEKSLLLRGINGTFNHPKLHFVESVSLSGSGNNRRFDMNSAKVNGFESSWLGLRFDKYFIGSGNAPGEIDVNAYSGANRDYLMKFIGQYQRTTYTRISDPFSREDGEIMLPGDVKNLPFDPRNPDQWTYAASGNNLYTIINPEDYLTRKGDLNPDDVSSGGLPKVKANCLGASFNESNGITRDSCNNNVDVKQEFEEVKSRYREAVINWMREEKRSYDNQ